MKLENVLIPQCVRGFPSANSIPGGTLAGKPLGTLLPALVDMHVHIDKGGTL